MTTPVLFRLVTLPEVKAWLGILTDDRDIDLEQDIIDCSQAIMDYIGNSLKLRGWTEEDTNGDPIPGRPLVYTNGDPHRIGAAGSVNSAGNFDFDLDTNGDRIDEGISIIPGPVRKATIALVARMDDDREGEKPFISPGIESILARYYDPPVA